MRRMSGYPRWFYPALMVTLLGVLVSGLLLVPTMLVLRLEWDVALPRVHDWRTVSAAAHSFLGFLALTFTGAVASIHLRTGLRRHFNVKSGISLLVLWAVMASSAVAIYYVGDETWSRSASVIHLLAALAALLIFVWHHLRGDYFRRRH